MDKRRLDRVNSLLLEVLSDVIAKEVKDPHLPGLITVTQVKTSPDLQYAKVYVSVIGDAQHKREAIKVLKRASGFIATRAAKEVQLRYFPSLSFFIDDTLDHQIHIEEILKQIRSTEQKQADE